MNKLIKCNEVNYSRQLFHYYKIFLINLPANGHTFYFKTAAGTGTVDTISGTRNNGIESGKILWKPYARGTLYYQCSLHAGMVEIITIQ